MIIINTISKAKYLHSVIEQNYNSIEQLKKINPFLIDATLRENSVGSPVGQTLDQKISIFKKLKDFGFKNILIGALNYSLPNELQVDDDFMIYLRDSNIDTSDCYCLTDVGLVQNNNFIPSVSQEKMKLYQVPNTLHEIYLSKDNIKGSIEENLINIKSSVNWIHQNISQKSKIFINIVDGCDAFTNNLDSVLLFLESLATLNIEGLSIEDDRGTYFPFQIKSFIEIIKQIIPSHLKLLVHFHASAGMENASTIEALLSGADGVWGGISKAGGVSGHSSLGELIGNLVRVGNEHLTQYKIHELLPLIHEIETINYLISKEAPVYGESIYQLNLSYFKQKLNRFMDLPPEKIGGHYTYKICPVMSDSKVIAARLEDVLGLPKDDIPIEVLECMIVIMRKQLRKGYRTEYNLQHNLISLYKEANEKINIK